MTLRDTLTDTITALTNHAALYEAWRRQINIQAERIEKLEAELARVRQSNRRLQAAAPRSGKRQLRAVG